MHFCRVRESSFKGGGAVLAPAAERLRKQRECHVTRLHSSPLVSTNCSSLASGRQGPRRSSTWLDMPPPPPGSSSPTPRPRRFSICLLGRFAGNLWALPVDGCCMQLASHKHYLISVSASAEETCSGSPVSAPSQECFLTIFRANPDTRFVAFCCSFPRVAHIVSALDSLYVICRDDSGGSILFELREKGIGDRLNILLRKRLFDWAADIVIQEGQPKSTLQEVYRVHADWLYEKRALDKALRMYIKTIGALEPSYVIEKFLHCQRLWLLALYLLHLHRCGRASQQHTLLFFKCAAKLKDENLFSAFLDDPSISRDAILPAAIQECRANGYLKLASLIARRHGHHDEYVSIFLTDCR
ncbi:hypothetical protein TGFOU_230220A, partial [Toxoplasma gondii FOU]